MRQFSLKLFIGLTLGLLIFVSEVYGATLTSSIDRNPIKINQTLTLTVQYDDQVNSSELDLSKLANDFEILSNAPSNNSSISIINGQTTRESTTSWRIVLAPKKDGVLSIPAFSVNGTNSSPISVLVNSLSAAELAQPQPLSVSLTIDDTNNLNIKPGEQIILTMEISAAANISDLARVDEFKINGADIEELGQQNGQRLENGVPRQVFIISYAIFPTKSGQLEIPAQTLTGYLGRRSAFDAFRSRGQQVSAASVAQTIMVEPTPISNGKTWFPANDVSIESSWSGDIDQVRVGEPITRSITITALGQNATVIPPLVNSSQTNYKAYKDQPQLESTKSNQGITGVRIESEAIVPSSSGELTLVEQRISWWDNVADEWREAVLPEETLTILPAVGGNVVDNLSSNTNDSNNFSAADKSQVINDGSNLWWKASTLGLGILCLLQFYFLTRKQQPLKPKHQKQSSVSQSETNAWKALQQALKENNNETSANAIRHAILNWGASALPHQALTNLQSLASLSHSSDLKDTFMQLEQQLYSDGTEFDKNQLTLQLNEFRDKIKQDSANQVANKSELAPLYPN